MSLCSTLLTSQVSKRAQKFGKEERMDTFDAGNNKEEECIDPRDSDMVCLEHFVHGMPTDENRYPLLRLGYDPPPKKARRVVLRPEIFPANQINGWLPLVEIDGAETSTAVKTDSKGDPVQLNGEPNHGRGGCADYTTKSSLIGALVNGIKPVSLERDQLKEKVGQLSQKIVRDVSNAKDGLAPSLALHREGTGKWKESETCGLRVPKTRPVKILTGGFLSC